MNPGFDKNEAEFRVLIFTVALKVLADSDSLKCVSANFYFLEEAENGNGKMMLPS